MAVQFDNKSESETILVINQNVQGLTAIDNGAIIDSKPYMSLAFFINVRGDPPETVSFLINQSNDPNMVIGVTQVPNENIIGDINDLTFSADIFGVAPTIGVFGTDRYLQLIGIASSMVTSQTILQAWAVGGLFQKPQVNIPGGAP